MPCVADTVEEITNTIADLRSAAVQDTDPQRRHSAEQLERQFAGITDSHELRAAARHALRLYGGGMGGLQDAGSSAMASAITRLSEALRQAI